MGLPRFMTTCRVRYLGDFSNTEAETTWETSKKQRLKTILMALKLLSVPIFVQVSLFFRWRSFQDILFGIFSGLSFFRSFFSGSLFSFFSLLFVRLFLQVLFFSDIFQVSFVHILYSFCFFQVSFSSDFFSFFSGVIFHGRFSGYIFCMIRFDFFRLPGKPLISCSGFMWCFSVFLLPSSRNEAAACASFADLDGDGNLEALTGCNCLFLVFGG